MKSLHSDSLILVWRVAEFEARHSKASTIEPTHLLLGLPALPRLVPVVIGKLYNLENLWI
jgi:hypothetical protein